MYVSCGGPLTRSGSLLSIEDMSLDVISNSAVSTQHYCQYHVASMFNSFWTGSYKLPYNTSFQLSSYKPNALSIPSMGLHKKNTI